MTDHDHHHADPAQTPPTFWRSRSGTAFIIFAAAAALLLGYEHRLHLFAGNWLPAAVMLGCLAMHSFMHGGHGGQFQKPDDRNAKDKK